MKKTLLLLGVLLSLFSCKETGKNGIVLTTSSGRINHLTIVADKDLWQGKVGEVLRENLASPVEGLPQQEPLFTISHIPSKAFKGFVKKNRTFLKIQKREKAEMKVITDSFSRPQTGIYLSAKTSDAIINLFKENQDKIVSKFKTTELREQQNRISKSLESDAYLEENLGVSLKFPSAYRYAKKQEDFVWLRKEIPNGSMEILIYEVPLSTIDADTNVVGNIIKMRDSIGKQFIPGPNEGSYLKTEAAYAPYLFETKLDKHFAYETKGTWDVKGAFMAGPFLNYAIRDKANQRYVILEGFIFRPSASKRDHVFELESILKSVKLK